MDARLTPRRLLMGAAALVALVAVTSGCGGGTYPQVYDALGRFVFVGLSADF